MYILRLGRNSFLECCFKSNLRERKYKYKPKIVRAAHESKFGTMYHWILFIHVSMCDINVEFNDIKIFLSIYSKARLITYNINIYKVIKSLFKRSIFVDSEKKKRLKKFIDDSTS